MNSKSVPKTLGVLGLLMIMIVSVVLITPVVSASPDNDYMTVSGVLSDDYYKLYPYKKKSLNIGFSKYGEMIDSGTNVGLEYGDVDPFAPPAGSAVGAIPKVMWLNGWLINITYYHNTLGWRNVWATAQFSDSIEIGGPWLRVDFKGPPINWDPSYGWEDPRDPGYDQWNYAAGLKNGGRKTNGTAYTDPIKVLYDGPRKFIAVLTTIIHDHPRIQDPSTASDIPLVKLVITIVFNKVKKEVILLKDVKSLVTEKVAAELKVQFSNRGEVDLGTEAAGYHSYFHFYTQGTAPEDKEDEGQSTVYNDDYELFQSEDPKTTDYKGFSAAGPFPQADGATYDVAQVINTGAKYVFFAAFWPSLNDWSIDGWNMWWRSMDAVDPHWIDADPTRPPFKEPKIPYYIGEWDFVLEAKEFTKIQFRGVTVYGITDLNDGSDTPPGVIDKEVRYQLDEVFNPWDLRDVVEKGTKRWVQFYTVKAADVGKDLYIPLNQRPVLGGVPWDAYCSFAERVLWLSALKKPMRAGGADYELHGPDPEPNPGWGRIYIPAAKVPAAGTVIKILYSTRTGTMVTKEWTWKTTFNDTVGGEAPNYIGPQNFTFTDSWTDELSVGHTVELVDVDFTAWKIADITENHTLTGIDTMLKGFWYKAFPFGVEGVLSYNYSHSDTLIALEGKTLLWHMAQAMDQHVWINGMINVSLNHTVTYYPATTTLNSTITVNLKMEYWEWSAGRYEWVVVGQHSRAIDSIGAAMVSETFDSEKQVETGLGGLDMQDVSGLGPKVPYLLWDMGKAPWRVGAPAWTDWYDTKGRLALKDDWCTTWPISSSNIISVGGGPANLVSEYFNEFTDALFIYGLPSLPINDKILPVTCWDKLSATHQYGAGYAVITTYKDLNGTVGFLVYGYTGEDTYYASKWFHEGGIHTLQMMNRGVTTLILKIDYTTCPYSASVVEKLGTISEKPVHKDP